MSYLNRTFFIISITVIVIIFIYSILQFGNTQMKESQQDKYKEQASTTTKPEKLNIIVDELHRSYAEKISEEYEKSYGIKVTITSIDYHNLYGKITKITDEKLSKTDLVLVDTVWIKELAEKNILESLTKYVPGNLRNEIIPIAYEQGLISNDLYVMPDLYAFPVSIEGKFLYYNEKLLKKIGVYAPPKTWEELINIVNHLQSNQSVKHGLIWGWESGEGLICDYTLLLNAMGGTFKDESGSWVFNELEGLKALEFMAGSLQDKNLTDPLSLTLSDVSVVKEFETGEIPFMVNWSHSYRKLKKNPDIKMALVPGFKDHLESSTVIGGSALGVVRHSKNKDWAWKFIELANNKRNEIPINEFTGSIPVWNYLIENLEVNGAYPNISLMTEQFEYAVNRPRITAYSDWSEVMQNSISAAITGEKSPEVALNEAQKIIKEKGIK